MAYNLKDYPPGTQFCDLTVISVGEPFINTAGCKIPRLLCKCVCGVVKPFRLSLLTFKDPKRRTTSCGCGLARRNKANASHNLCDDPLYRLWGGIKARCYNQANPMYYLYGGRGISLFEPWRAHPEAFMAYVKDTLGERPDGYSIDRFPDKNGNYEPGNIRWASATQQQANTRYNVSLRMGDREMIIAEWVKETGISHGVIRSRIARGWTIEQALTIKPGSVNRWTSPSKGVRAE